MLCDEDFECPIISRIVGDDQVDQQVGCILQGDEVAARLRRHSGIQNVIGNVTWLCRVIRIRNVPVQAPIS